MRKRNARKSKQPNDVLKTSTCKANVRAAPIVESNGELYKLKRHLDVNKCVGVYEKSSNDSTVLKIYPSVTCSNGVSVPNEARQVMMKLCGHSALIHPHIDQCKDLFTDDDGTLHTEHEYYPKGCLVDAWKADKPSTREIVVCFDQTSSAVQHGHQNGLLHGDIKLANMMKRGEEDCLMSDWDSALNLTDIKVGLGNAGFGTYTYRSPEQINCHHEFITNGTTSLCRLYSEKTDGYQVGCALCKILYSETTDYDSVDCETLNFEKNLICPANVDPFLCELARDLVKENPAERITLSEFRERLSQGYHFRPTEDTNANKDFVQAYTDTSRIQSVVKTQMPETSCYTEQQSSCVPTKTETESSTQQQSRLSDQQPQNSASTGTSSMKTVACLAGALVCPLSLSSPASTSSSSFNTPSSDAHKPGVGGIFLRSKPVHRPTLIRPLDRNRIFGRR